MNIGLSNRTARCGFNAIEFLVGTAVIVIVGVSLYAGIGSSFNTMGASRDRIRATQIMMERVEGLRLYNWNQLVYSNMMPQNFATNYYPFASGTESKGILYRGRVDVSSNVSLNPSATYADLMRKVTVSIWWISSGVSNYNSLTTYVSRDGIQNYVYAD